MANKDESSSAKYKKPMGTYIPPAKRVKAEKFDVGSEDYQRCAWDENKRKITGLINRASPSNIKVIVKELFNCNLIRYRGLFASALLRAQEKSPVFTNVYAALLAVINSRIRSIGELVVNRLILQYRIAFKNNNKTKLITSAKFIAHLTNQEVVYEVLGFQLIEHLMHQQSPTLIEILITFLKECGSKLEQTNGNLLFESFRTLRDLSLDNEYDTRTNELINQIHTLRKERFREYPPIVKELDLVAEEDRITHEIALSDPPEGFPGKSPRKEDFRMELNYFKFDPRWSENEEKYEDFKKSLLDEAGDSSSDYETSSDEDQETEDDQKETQEDKKPVIKEEKGVDEKDVKPERVVDATGSDLIAFRRMVYLTIKSSVRHEEVVHKLLKSRIKPELNEELCQMILDCCGQARTYEQIYGLVAARLCEINRMEFAPILERLMVQFYEVVQQFESQPRKIMNVAIFYAHLLVTESINWSCLGCFKLRQNTTTSAKRCFIKFLFQELVSLLSMHKLFDYLTEQLASGDSLKDLFPANVEEDQMFAKRFFESCGMKQLATLVADNNENVETEEIQKITM